MNHNEKARAIDIPSLRIVSFGLVMICLIFSIVLNVMSFHQNQELNHLIRENVLNEIGETQEDDVKIAGEYIIRSTLALSDAYKKGDRSKLDDRQKETLDMAAAILDDIITEDMSDFEKEKAVYDWMTSNLKSDSGLLTVIPNTQADSDNPYGVLKYHNAVCVGYAVTFRLFMQMMDIPCMVIHNTELFHTWDLVQLDGHWYHTDIYSDVGESHYAHFNLDDSMCLKDQEWDTSYFPAADSLEYNIVCMEAEDGVDIYELPAIVREMLERDAPFISLHYDEDFTEEKAHVASQILNAVDERIHAGQDFNNYSLSYGFSKVEDGYVLQVFANKFEDDEDEIRLSEEELEKLRKALDETFGEASDLDDLGDYEMDEDDLKLLELDRLT